jgi:ribosomal protein S18 acetylase RimI-like enzyme
VESPLSFREAVAAEAPAIAALVNSAYRGEASKAGWTTEADLLEGPRTDEAEVRALIEAPDSLILLCIDGDAIIGSVHLQKQGASAYLGMWVVQPTLQGRGIGKRFMRAAEELVQREWHATRMTMTVLKVRDELIAFYERRGYRQTGVTRPFPDDAPSVPKVTGLEFETLEKDLTSR